MQFYVYSNTNPASKGQYPYLLDVQNSLLADLKTRLVIPLTAQANCRSGVISKLCPVFNINGETFVALTQQMTGIESRLLGAEVADLSAFELRLLRRSILRWWGFSTQKIQQPSWNKRTLHYLPK